jgi:hypothetical protein
MFNCLLLVLLIVIELSLSKPFSGFLPPLPLGVGGPHPHDFLQHGLADNAAAAGYRFPEFPFPGGLAAFCKFEFYLLQ